jgi:hypothetical protein
MKEIIARIYLKQLKNETHVQFNESINRVFVKYNPQTLGITPLYALYKPAFDNELAALDFIRKSEFTQQITEQDRVRDSIFRGLADAIKAAMNHFDPAHREAARRLHDVFAHYGNIARKTFDDETAAINDLNRELQIPANAVAIALLGLTNWHSQLMDENENFEQLMMNRYSETAEKTSLRMTNTRTEVDKYYHATVNQLENLSLTGITGIDGCINEMNAVIERFRNILAQEQGERKDSPPALSTSPPALSEGEGAREAGGELNE